MTTTTEEKAIYKFNWDCGRMGDLEGVFVATVEEINGRLGKEIHFGEVLGKHSEITGKLEAKDVKLISYDPVFVKLFEDNNLETGHNPLRYPYVDENGEWVDV